MTLEEFLLWAAGFDGCQVTVENNKTFVKIQVMIYRGPARDSFGFSPRLIGDDTQVPASDISETFRLTHEQVNNCKLDILSKRLEYVVENINRAILDLEGRESSGG